ncbi:MAG: ATP-binding cassette domain-containing protein [Actinomycetota bacterium]|nr:ATP-binding cassette domain-containing protein [Actinomycetota bacterium]
MALILDNVSFAYGEGTQFATPAVRRVGLSVGRGELTLVLGPTGSGKSTLLRLAAGLLRPTGGLVTLDGQAVKGVVAGEREGVGLLFQSPETQLFAETVVQDVEFGPVNQGRRPQDAREDAVWALESVGLDPESFGDRSPFTLSGGEARRAALAGVLASRPGYLLLDEPTAGLDADGRAAVVELIIGLKEHAGIAVVTHDAEEFLPHCDRVLVLTGGARVFEGSPEELLVDVGVLEEAGLFVPDVLRIQLEAVRRGAVLERFELDPDRAATALVRAGVGRT